MSDSNPYETQAGSTSTSPAKTGLSLLGRLVLGVGLIALGYGGVAFWLLTNLPPNTTDSRLPSLYVMGAGVVVTLVGLVLRGIAVPNKTDSGRTGVPSWLGILILLAILAGFFAVVSRM